MSTRQTQTKRKQHGGGVETSYLMGESKSVWNYSLCSGWLPAEASVLITLLQYYGVGKWTHIYNSGRLPSKTIQQMYLQTQRIVGQQSLAAFMGLKLDLQRIGLDNAATVSIDFYSDLKLGRTQENGFSGERRRQGYKRKKVYIATRSSSQVRAN
jgi:hypothetical protein